MAKTGFLSSSRFIAKMKRVPHWCQYNFDLDARGEIKDMQARSLSFYHAKSGRLLGTIRYDLPGAYAIVEEPKRKSQ